MGPWEEILARSEGGGEGERKTAVQRVFVFLLVLCNYRWSKFRLQEEWLEQRQQVTRKCVDMRVKHLLCFGSLVG